MSDYGNLQKACQRGSTSIADANNLLAECHAALGKLIAENEALRKDAKRYRHLKLDATDDGSLIERLDCNISIMNWDSAIDSAMGKGERA